jgi:hypothetical protein
MDRNRNLQTTTCAHCVEEYLVIDLIDGACLVCTEKALAWANLFEEARSLGMTAEDVREALDEIKRNGGVLR